MATPVNDVWTTLSAQFVHGTDVTIDGVDCSLFESTGYFTVRTGGTTDWNHYARYKYTGKAANQLTGLTLCTLGNVESEAAYTFPIGAVLEVGAMAEYVDERVVGPASATDEHIFVADGVTGKLAKDGGATIAELALLAGRAGGQTLVGSASTDSGLVLRATSGAGAAGSDIVGQVGNNGATEALRIRHDGIWTTAQQSGARGKRITTNQSIDTGSWTTVQLNGEDYDIRSEFDTGTYTFTATVAGVYLAVAAVHYPAALDTKTYMARIAMGSLSYTITAMPGADGEVVLFPVAMNALAATDTVYLRTYHNSGVAKVIQLSTTWLAIQKVA